MTKVPAENASCPAEMIKSQISYNVIGNSSFPAWRKCRSCQPKIILNEKVVFVKRPFFIAGFYRYRMEEFK